MKQSIRCDYFISANTKIIILLFIRDLDLFGEKTLSRSSSIEGETEKNIAASVCVSSILYKYVRRFFSFSKLSGTEFMQ